VVLVQITVVSHESYQPAPAPAPVPAGNGPAESPPLTRELICFERAPITRRSLRSADDAVAQRSPPLRGARHRENREHGDEAAGTDAVIGLSAGPRPASSACPRRPLREPGRPWRQCARPRRPREVRGSPERRRRGVRRSLPAEGAEVTQVPAGRAQRPPRRGAPAVRLVPGRSRGRGRWPGRGLERPYLAVIRMRVTPLAVNFRRGESSSRLVRRLRARWPPQAPQAVPALGQAAPRTRDVGRTAASGAVLHLVPRTAPERGDDSCRRTLSGRARRPSPRVRTKRRSAATELAADQRADAPG
jgi:hypothetical protein